MTTNITETLPWIDYGEVFRKLEARGEAKGRTEGEAKGRAERDALIRKLKELGVTDEAIKAIVDHPDL